MKTVGGKPADDVREALVEELYRDFGERRAGSLRIRMMRAGLKKYTWLAVVNSTIFVKRAMDILVGGLALLLLSPLFLVVAILIKLEDRGPVMYFQTRVGQWGREFPFPKFRSMVTNSEEIRQKLLAENQNQHGDSITFKMKRDPRVTRVGGVIRKLSIDELPQLWCVLKGEMSLVGPRPPLVSEVARYSLKDRQRLEVKPGLTCIWQVSGRSELAFDQQLSLDLEYIQSHSILLDIALLLRTVPAILSGRGAY